MRQVAGGSRGGEEDYIFPYRVKEWEVAAVIQLERQCINTNIIITHTLIRNKSITVT